MPTVPRGSNLNSTNENMVADMDPETDEKVTDVGKPEDASMRQSSIGTVETNRSESIEENLEKLAALNLSNDQFTQPRLSTSMIRLVSAVAGIGALVMIYLVVKLFY